MRDTPSIYYLGLPPEEQEIGRLIWDNLDSLSQQVRLFKTALGLADYCDAERAPYRPQPAPQTGIMEYLFHSHQAMLLNRQFIEWKQVAARDGAITLSNYAETKQVLDDLKALSPTIFGLIDRDALRDANRLFDKAFPGYADIRLSVAHAGRLSKSKEEDAKHRIPGTKIRITQMLSGRRLISSINDKVAHYDLTPESAATLEQVTDHIYRAYEEASAFTMKLSRRRPETPPPPEQD